MKKFVSLLLALAVTCALLPAAGAEGLSVSVPTLDGTAYDAPQVPSWAAGSYARLQELGLLSVDYPRVSGGITRGEFAGLLANGIAALVPSTLLEPYPPAAWDYFGDQVFDLPLLQSAAFGILEGRVEDGVRYADAYSPLTREQAAKMVCAALDFFERLGLKVEASAPPAVYHDTGAISAWAAPYTGRVASYSIMVGDQAGDFVPAGELDWPSAVVVLARTMERMDQGAAAARPGLTLHSGLDWSGAARFGANDHQVSKPRTGYAMGYYTIDNGDGTVSGLIVPPSAETYDREAQGFGTVSPQSFFVERYDGRGDVVSSKTLPVELPLFGGFFDSGEHFYLAFGQENASHDDSQEVWRVVQYDRDWRRLGAVAVTGGESYTQIPYRATVSRFAVSEDGGTVALYAARQRCDGHQSNITILMDAAPFRIQKILGEQFPDNHISHSFGQFVRFDGKKLVTVDHGDAYPRSFVLQAGGSEEELLKIAGPIGENVTNAIGSGFEVSGSGYLFLGCSDPQRGGQDEPWNVFLTYTDKDLDKTSLTWLTHSDTTIDCARLVKLSDDRFAAMWSQGGALHYRVLDGRGSPVDQEEAVVPGMPMPATQPVVRDGERVSWIGCLSYGGVDRPTLFTLEP